MASAGTGGLGTFLQENYIHKFCTSSVNGDPCAEKIQEWQLDRSVELQNYLHFFSNVLTVSGTATCEEVILSHDPCNPEPGQRPRSSSGPALRFVQRMPQLLEVIGSCLLLLARPFM